VDARQALALLEGTGISLVEAARMALERGAGASVASVTVDEAVAGFLQARRAKGLRNRTLEWYGIELVRFAESVPVRRLDQVTRTMVRGYVQARARGSQGPAWRAVRALFRFARRQEPPWVLVDPTEGLVFETPRQDGRRVSVLRPEQAEVLLRAGELRRYRAAVALALFAGVRPGELGEGDKPPLRWEHVQEADRVVRVPAEVSKTRVTRVLEGLPEALWAWLAAVPREEKVGPVAPGRFRQVVRPARRLLGLEVWPADCTRHSFASYAVALLGDAGQVALWLGHEGDQRLLHRHYRGLVSRADAERFFGLRP